MQRRASTIFLSAATLAFVVPNAFAAPDRISTASEGAEPTKVRAALADDLLRQGKAEEALRAYGDLLKNAGKNADLYFGRGKAHALLKHWKEAAADFDRVIVIRPDWYQAYSRRGDVRFRLKDMEGAKRDFEMLRKLNPDLVDGYIKGAATALSARKPREGIEIINGALPRFPQSAEIYIARGRCCEKSGKLDAAREDFARAVKIDKRSSDGWHELTQISRHQKNHEQGRKESLAWTKELPKDVRAWHSLGYFCESSQRYAQAASAYTRAAELEPGQMSHIARRATVNCKRKRYKDAIADAKMVLEKEPNNADMYSVLASGYTATGNPNRSIECATRCLELSSDHKWLYELRGQEYFRLENFAKAVEDWNRAIAWEPKGWQYAQRAKAYMGLGQAKEAMADLTKAIQMQPRSDVYEMRGRLHQINGDHDLAVADFTRALEIGGPGVGALRERSVSYRHLGKLEEAVRDMSGVIKIIPGEPKAYTDRAKLYDKLGKTALARQDRERAHQLGAQDFGRQ